MTTTLSGILERFDGQAVAVVGDVMLDHFLVGRVDRISPEAPVPVVRFDHDEYRLGGAANVAHNLAALGATVRLVGVIGNDPPARELQRALANVAIAVDGLVTDARRPTTRKMRVVTSRNQQVARVDYEDDADTGADVLEAITARVNAAGRQAKAIVVSDYRKGVVTPGTLAAAMDVARSAGAPLLVDPKMLQPERYRGATLITPNHHEAEVMTQTAIRTSDDVRMAARALHERTGANVLITWGEHGMWVFDAASTATVEEHLPAAAREVADVTGAGDTVIAVLAMALAAGGRLRDAARLANAAAGLVVARFGPAAIGLGDLRAATLAAKT